MPSRSSPQRQLTGYDGPPSALANPGGNAIMALSADVRRVVTTIDSKDKAVVLLDGTNPHKKVRPQTQTVSRLLWVTDQTPADLSGSADRAAILSASCRRAAARSFASSIFRRKRPKR